MMPTSEHEYKIEYRMPERVMAAMKRFNTLTLEATILALCDENAGLEQQLAQITEERDQLEAHRWQMNDEIIIAVDAYIDEEIKRKAVEQRLHEEQEVVRIALAQRQDKQAVMIEALALLERVKKAWNPFQTSDSLKDAIRAFLAAHPAESEQNNG